MLERFFIQLSTEPDTISFEQSINLIDSLYLFTPVAFKNGDLYNSAGENNGSCKILAFGLLHQLSAPQTLHLFGDYYRAVLDTPKGTDHQNIRNFIRNGWDGVAFDTPALTAKAAI
ncbi:HopJ type III effector protein [Rheinheimera sp. NSM]|uniref:HopJ type III effector protein n=1 Tax=Rheinheimera sp. NSM TaxID=3457884 RepID=UPI004036D1EC